MDTRKPIFTIQFGAFKPGDTVECRKIPYLRGVQTRWEADNDKEVLPATYLGMKNVRNGWYTKHSGSQKKLYMAAIEIEYDDGEIEEKYVSLADLRPAK